MSIVFALVLTSCGATSDDGRDTKTAPEARGSPASLSDKCTERLIAGVPEVEREQARHYVEATYCARFADRGWVYDDGALSIEAHMWLENAGEEECALATPPGEPAKTIPCERFDERGPYFIADCGLLKHVRASDVRTYLDELRRRYGTVQCEDGTPLNGLATP